MELTLSWHCIFHLAFISPAKTTRGCWKLFNAKPPRSSPNYLSTSVGIGDERRLAVSKIPKKADLIILHESRISGFFPHASQTPGWHHSGFCSTLNVAESMCELDVDSWEWCAFEPTPTRTSVENNIYSGWPIMVPDAFPSLCLLVPHIYHLSV